MGQKKNEHLVSLLDSNGSSKNRVFVDAPNTNQIYGEVFILEDSLLSIDCETTVLIDPQLNTTFSEILSQPFGTM